MIQYRWEKQKTENNREACCRQHWSLMGRKLRKKKKRITIA